MMTEQLAYEIEQLYIEGFSPKYIAATLGCSMDLVHEWIESIGTNVEVEEDFYEDYGD